MKTLFEQSTWLVENLEFQLDSQHSVDNFAGFGAVVLLHQIQNVNNSDFLFISDAFLRRGSKSTNSPPGWPSRIANDSVDNAAGFGAFVFGFHLFGA